MTDTDQKQLLIIFLGIGIILAGVLFWFLRSQATTSERAYRAANEEFRQELPRLIMKAGLGLHFEELTQADDALPEMVFRYRKNGDTRNLTKRLEKLVGSRFTILDKVTKDELVAYGLSFNGRPLGRLLLTPDHQNVRATVGIIIDDFGYYDNGVIEGFLELPPKLAFAVIPGHEYSQSIARRAYDKGFDVLIHMPMEPQEYSGGEEQYILRSGMPSRQLIQRVNRAFADLPMAVGMNNHQGSLATEDPQLMQTVLHLLRDQHLFFVDSYTTPNTVGYELARKLSVPTGKRAVFLDNTPDTTYIKNQLDQLITQALKHGQAIGIGHNKKLTLQVLRRYIPYYEQQGIRFARVSEVLEYPDVVM